MTASRKVIITCAVTGSIHTPTMTPHLPITGAQIARSAIGAYEAGASILHLHARDPQDGPLRGPGALHGVPSRDRAGDRRGGQHHHGRRAQWMTLEQRLAAALAASPEMSSLNMGSMNFGLYPMKDRDPTFQHDWEPEYLESSRDLVFKNTFKDIERILRELGEGHGTRFGFECYDIGHLYTLAHFLDRKLVTPPLFVQSVFGILGGMGADADNLVHARRIADRLFGDQYQWSVLAAGRHQMPFATEAALRGGNVRVGIEDSIYLGKGQLAHSNADQVAKIRSILEQLGLDIASPADVRTMLKLKGKDGVRF